MNMKRAPFFVMAAIAACAGLSSSARADEIWLKDGSKIVGTIVGYEDISFKVATSYGFAMVRKDSILEILPGDAKPTAAMKTAPAKPSDPPPTPLSAEATPPAPTKPLTALPAPQAEVRPEPTPASYATPLPEPKPRAAAAPAKPVPPPAVQPAVMPAPVALATPAPGPPVVQEFVRGNLYINQTYGFQMFRPPGWELVKDAAQSLPNAIAALGTGDETTLLLISRDAPPKHEVGPDHGHVPDPLDLQSAATERTLNKVYDDYKVLTTSRTTAAGVPAIEQHARGVADGHAWSVVVLTFGRDTDVFTLLGMTYADSDVIQIRENVIARMIASLQFTPPAAR